MFDLNTVLRVEPRNVRALCGRALLHLALDQQKVAAPPSPTGPGTRRLGGGRLWGAGGAQGRPGHCLPSQPQGQRERGQATRHVRCPLKPLRTGAHRGSLVKPWVSGSLPSI